MRFNGMRVLTQFLAGHHPGPDAAISKLYWSEYHKEITELAIDIIGAEAMTPTGRHPSSAFSADDAGAPNSTWSWVGTFLNARAGTIYAGSSHRCSATSSVRWCSACPRSRGCEPNGRSAAHAAWPPSFVGLASGVTAAARQWRRTTPRGWWQPPSRSYPCPAATTCTSGWSLSTAAQIIASSPPMC
jgi:hypothetical protein